MRYIYIILALVFTSCLQEAHFKSSFDGFVPMSGLDDTEIGEITNTEADVTLLTSVFELVHDKDRFPGAKSLLIYKDRVLVAESYPGGDSLALKPESIQSCTKSITSLAVGALIQNGFLAPHELFEPLHELLPDAFPVGSPGSGLTLDDLLTMRSGYDFDNSIDTRTLFELEGSSLDWLLGREQLFPHGQVTNYNDGDPHIVGAIVQELSTIPFHRFVENTLFQPLGITNYHWEQGADDLAYGAFGLHVSPRDLGKLGLLMANYGLSNGDLLVAPAFLESATSVHTVGDFNGIPYGYYFWIFPSLDGFAALGHGGQFIFVIPEENVLAVYTADPYTHPDQFGEFTRLMELIARSMVL